MLCIQFLYLYRLNLYQVNGMIIYPATAMIAAVVQGAEQLSRHQKIRGFELHKVLFKTALAFETPSTEVEVELRFQKTSRREDEYHFRLYSFQSGVWTLHCQGVVTNDYSEDRQPSFMNSFDMTYEKAKASFDHVTSASSKRTDNFTLYHLLSKLGYQYGPSFQLLEEVCCIEGGQAAALVKTVSQDCINRSAIKQAHVVHPAVLDVVLELALVAATNGAQASTPTMVPSGIGSIWISSSGMTLSQDIEIPVITQCTTMNRNRMTASATAFSRHSNEVFVQVRDLETRAITERVLDQHRDTSNHSNLTFDLVWTPDIELMTPQQVLNYCWEGERQKESERAILEVERDIVSFLFHTLTETKERIVAGSIIPPQPHLQKYVQWMDWQIQMFMNGSHEETYKRYINTSYNEAELRRVRELAMSSKVWRFYLAVADNLYDMICGKLEPLQLLFGQNYATDYYMELNRYGRCVSALESYIKLIAHKDPNMRIFEVGGGTGATTRSALDALTMGGTVSDRFACYDFTDVSPTLVAAAQESLGSEHPAMNFGLFDIEKSPREQGFEPRSYDVVIAASVLHASADIAKTLRNVRSLLKDGGKLLFTEGVRPENVKMGFGFGLLPGWWLGMLVNLNLRNTSSQVMC
jgi:SAM-dependent methyltransferase